MRSSRTPNRVISRPRVYLFKTDFRDDPGVGVHLPETMSELLSIATNALHLVRPAKQILDSSNDPILDISKIRPNASLYVSCAEPFTFGEEKPVYKSRLPKNRSSADGLTLPIVKQAKGKTKTKPKREDLIQQQALASSPLTVKQNARYSMLALYSGLSPDHKAQLTFSDELQRQSDDSRMAAVEDQLIKQQICPSSCIEASPFGQQTVHWVIDKMKGLKPEHCRFAICGPQRSGKTTLLSIAVKLFFQKCLLAQESLSYLIVPFNWMTLNLHIESLQKLYAIMVSTTMNALKGSRFELVPIISSLQQWFMSLASIPGFPPLPPCVLHFNGLPTQLIVETGSRIHKAWGKEEGLELILSLPKNLAKVFGYKNAVYVCDNFDMCEYSNVLCNVLADVPFFVASHGREFSEEFRVENYIQLETERIIENAVDRELFIVKPDLSLSIDMCNGCPGYCAMYAETSQFIADSLEKSCIKSQFTSIKSIIDSARMQLIRHRLIQFILLLSSVEESLDEEKINELIQCSEMTIKVR